MKSFKQAAVIYLYFLACLLIKTINCKRHHGCDSKYHLTDHSISSVSVWVLIIVTIFFSLMCLVALGILKGLIGLFIWAPVGMWGLGALIDLPRPLQEYQESNLADFPVVYDSVGWPVHPETKKRSVRAVSKNTEFYLNTIFFLAYPLTVLISLFSACCLTETCGCEDENYKYVNTIVFSQLDEVNLQPSKCQDCNMYCDEDSTEEKDTTYVLQQMRHSEQSLNKSQK